MNMCVVRVCKSKKNDNQKNDNQKKEYSKKENQSLVRLRSLAEIWNSKK